MKFKNEIFQILSASILAAVLFMSFSWIGIQYQGTQDSLKESISLTVSFMGVVATVIAALIAVLLFNDWKEQHNLTRNSNNALNIFLLIESFKIKIENYSNSACNENKNNTSFIETHTTIYGEDISLLKNILELKKIRNDIIVEVRSFTKLIQKTPKDLGVDKFRECFDNYFNFITKDYIEKEQKIDFYFSSKTEQFKKQTLDELFNIQSKLEKVIKLEI